MGQSRETRSRTGGVRLCGEVDVDAAAASDVAASAWVLFGFAPAAVLEFARGREGGRQSVVGVEDDREDGFGFGRSSGAAGAPVAVVASGECEWREWGEWKEVLDFGASTAILLSAALLSPADASGWAAWAFERCGRAEDEEG